MLHVALAKEKHLVNQVARQKELHAFQGDLPCQSTLPVRGIHKKLNVEKKRNRRWRGSYSNSNEQMLWKEIVVIYICIYLWCMLTDMVLRNKYAFFFARGKRRFRHASRLSNNYCIYSYLAHRSKTRMVVILLMHHLGCIKPCKWWEKLPTSTR